MNSMQRAKLSRSALAAAVALTLGAAATPEPAHATTYTFGFSGYFTMLTSTGTPLDNSSYSTNSWSGYRTDISGSMTFNTATGTGSGTLVPFNFFNGTSPAAATGITLAAIGNGTCTGGTAAVPTGCGSGTLILGNMLFNWNGNNGIPVSIVLDGSGLFNAMGSGLTGGQMIGQTQTGDVLPASNYMKNGGFPIGPVPVATTTWNTTLIGAACTGTNGASCMGRTPSGGVPLVADTVVPSGYSVATTGIGGNPMIAGPFGGYNANFDITSMTVTAINGVQYPPTVSQTSPTIGTANANPLANPPVTITFDEPVEDNTVASAFSLSVTGGAVVPGTVSPSASGSYATQFSFTPTTALTYSTGYTATVAGGAVLNGGGQTMTSPYTWSFTTMAAPVTTNCTGGGPAPTPYTAGNFTMLTPTGTPFGGTNDVVYTWGGSTNTAVNGTNFNMTLASATPEPFFGFDWSAHDIRVFGPGSYTFNTGCSITELHDGVMPTACAIQPPNPAPNGNAAWLTMNVGAGQVGALMLFDWHGNDNIYVAEVWNQNASWLSGPGTENGMWTGPAWGGPSGYEVDPQASWALASTPGTNNGINGIPMANGPFIGFSANFNLNASETCKVAASAPIQAHDTGVAGCSISATPVNPFKRGDWFILLGFIGWLGWYRRKRRS